MFYVKENNSVLLNAIDFHQEEISFWSRNTKWFALSQLHNKIRILSSTAIFKQLLLFYKLRVTFIILDIISSSVFYLKHDISETGFCPRQQMKPTQMGPKTESILRKVVV
jgi:hypothetical protein